MASAAAQSIRVLGRPDTRQIRMYGMTQDTFFSIPAGFAISAIYLENTTANAITGGIDIGTTDTGVDVVSGFAVGASALKHIAEASLLLRYFSRTAATTLYLIAHTAWNSASLNVTVVLDKVSP